MNTDEQRETFELWYTRRHPHPVHENSTWANASKADDWEVWQAAVQTAAPTSHPIPTGATGEDGEKRAHKNGFGSVSFTLSDGSTVSCEWAPSQWEVSIPAKRLDRDVAFKELLQEIGRLRSAAPAAGDDLAAAARDVLAERQRQIGAEGWTPEHDDAYADEQLARAAVCYALPQGNYEIPEPPEFWPWDAAWWKPGERRRELIKAGALILAEIERLDRAAIAQQKGEA